MHYLNKETEYNYIFKKTSSLFSSLQEISNSLYALSGAAGRLLPKTVDDIFKSRACKGAIKFGQREGR